MITTNYRIEGQALVDSQGNVVMRLDGTTIRDHHGNAIFRLDGNSIKLPDGRAFAKIRKDQIIINERGVGTIYDAMGAIGGSATVPVAFWLALQNRYH